MDKETITLSVCQDCLMAVANGIDSIEDGLWEGHLELIVAGMEAWAVTGYHLAPGSEDYGFRWQSQCNVCESSEGGDRFEAFALSL